MVNNIEAKDHAQYSVAKIDVSLFKMAYFYLRTVAIFHQPVFFLLLILLDQVYLSFFFWSFKFFMSGNAGVSIAE